MHKQKHHQTVFMLIVAISLFFLLAVQLIANDEQATRNRGSFDQVTFLGEFQVDDGVWQPLLPESKFELDEHHTFSYRGNFNQEIEKNQLVMLRIADLRVRISVNGTELFTFGDSQTQSAGNVWESFVSPGITSADEVEITLYNVYTRSHPLSVEQFFGEMYIGSIDGLYRTTLRATGVSMLISFLILAIGILELIAAVILCAMKHSEAYRVFCSGAFTLFSGIWFCIQFHVISLLAPYHRLVGAVDVLSAYFMSAFFVMYVATYLTGRIKKISAINIFIALLLCALTSFLELIGWLDAYHTIRIGWMLCVINLLSCVDYLFVEYKKAHRRRIIANLGLSFIPIVAGALLDYVLVWGGFANDTQWLRCCFLLFVIIQLMTLLWNIRDNYEKAEQVQRLENELTQSRVSIMLSQIQPHFLYNSLAAIKHLCRTNPPMAEAAVLHFSDYLRGNLDSLSTEKPILFKKELSHIATYLLLEKMRFGEDLKIVYDIRCENFVLPVLTVQPLVENAVRYGVTKKEEGGTVTISTEETDANIIITVKDDGVGFDLMQENKGKTHVGIENVRSRLAAQCGGRLMVESTVGVGTTATITLFKGGNEDEYTCGG